MKFKGTRGESHYMNFTEVVLYSMAENGGLWVPVQFPLISQETQAAWRKLNYQDLCLEIMKLFIEEIPITDLQHIIKASFSNFKIEGTIELQKFEEKNYFLNLFHGPTYSFKDIPLQFLGNLFEYMIQNGYCSNINIVGSTSGDTGSAAIAGVKNKNNITCTILYPKDRTSLVQELQMTTSTDEKIKCLEIEGTFDDCQDIVKKMLSSKIKETHNLVAVNSTNFARILVQMTYFWYSSLNLSSDGKEKIDFTVPTGNFGNILSAYYARKMNAPIRHLIIASNSNDILTRFQNTGKYQSAPVIPTISPAMDIQLSSNFERYIFELYDFDINQTSEKYQLLKNDGYFTIDDDKLQKSQQGFFAFSGNEIETFEAISEVYNKFGIVIDPHTAVGYVSSKKFKQKYPEFASNMHVCVSTAHFGKFLDSVEKALGTHIWKESIPEDLKVETLNKLPQSSTTLPADKIKVEQCLLKFFDGL